MSAAASRISTEALKIEKVKEHIGAIVTGIDLAHPVDGATQKKLYDAVVENVVLVIRGQEHLTPGAVASRRRNVRRADGGPEPALSG